MNWLVFAIVVWCVFGLELGLKDALQLGDTGVAPSFAMILLVVAALSAPRITALWAGLLIGLLLDLTHSRPTPGGVGAATLVGPYALGCLLAAYTVLTMRVMVIRRNVLTVAFLSMVAAAMAHIVFTAILAMRSWCDPSIDLVAGHELLRRMGSSLYTGALALVIGPALLFLSPVMGFQQQGQRGARWR